LLVTWRIFINANRATAVFQIGQQLYRDAAERRGVINAQVRRRTAHAHPGPDVFQRCDPGVNGRCDGFDFIDHYFPNKRNKEIHAANHLFISSV
jgi:hypothetical protein